MKRWLVTYFDNGEKNLKLYCPSIDSLKEIYPNATIVEFDDTKHIPFINAIIEKSNKKYEINKNDYELQEVYEYISNFGRFIIILSKDLRDNHYYDYLKYTRNKQYSFVLPVLSVITTPQEFYEEFGSDFNFEIVSITKKPGSGEKLNKPAELKGVKQIGSVNFSKAANRVFVCKNDLFIHCSDYFSPIMKTAPEDVGTPLSYRANKYLNGKKISERFIYTDCWGAIVLRRKAWLKFSSFISLLPYYNDTQIANLCCKKNTTVSSLE